MKIENQVVSLDLSRRLRELGVMKKSMFMWYHYTTEDKANGIEDKWKIAMGSPTGLTELSAYTVAELGEMLPRKTQSEHYNNGDWYCTWGKVQKYGSTEADARAKMLCFLIENSIINII